jgi:hypothetical protein
MNTGTAATNYGFWFPGKENDGAAGWQFMSSKAGSAWMGSSYPGGVIVPRGPWNYDGEIDLGFGAALRMAATVLTRDPIFGWFTYGGAMTEHGDTLAINPRDGLRRRFDVVIPDVGSSFADDNRRVKVELDRDGFAADDAIVLDKKLDRIAFVIENRTGKPHATALSLSFPSNVRYTVLEDGKPVVLTPTDDFDYPWRGQLVITGPTSRVELVLKR